MSNQQHQSLREFSKFRKVLRTLARQALEASHPQYVQQFQAALEESGDLEEAIDRARPLLDEGIPQWAQLLTLELDFELSLDKLRRSLALLGTTVPHLGSDWNAGAWMEYHYDHWLYEAYAWLERLDKLVKRVCRLIIKPRSGEWRQIEKSLSESVRQMKENISKVRHPLVHGGGGGVTGPEEQMLWEPGLLLDGDVDIVYWMYQQAGQFQQKRYEGLLQVTGQAIARSEAIFKELNQQIVNLESKATG